MVGPDVRAPSPSSSSWSASFPLRTSASRTPCGYQASTMGLTATTRSRRRHPWRVESRNTSVLSSVPRSLRTSRRWRVQSCPPLLCAAALAAHLPRPLACGAFCRRDGIGDRCPQHRACPGRRKSPREGKMIKAHQFLRDIQRTYAWYAVLGAVVLGLLSVGNPAMAGGGNDQGGNEGEADRGAVRLLGTTPVPVTASNNTAGAMYSFDISWVDQERQLYFLADRSNKVVDVVDARTGKFLKQIAPTGPFAPFAGFKACVPPAGAHDCSGPNGVTPAEAPLPWRFVTDAPSRLLCINFMTGQTISEVSTRPGEPTRADELVYDPQDGLILAINNAASPPSGTFVKVNKSTCGLTRLNTIFLDAAHGVDAENGAEQPAWDPGTGKFYLSIPQIGPNVEDGGVVRIAPNATTVEHTYPVKFCSPAGLTLGPRDDALIGCSTVFDTAGKVWDPAGTATAAPKDVILNVKTGTTTDVLGVGAGDEVWFNRGDGNYYATGSGSPLRPLPAATAKGSTPLGVIDAKDRSLIQLMPTYNVPAAGTAHPAGTAHSVAVNAANNFVFVPLPANTAFPACLTGCIAVFVRPSKAE